MRILFALGNPGSQYENTRHNAGFIVADKLVQAAGDFSPFTLQEKFSSLIAERGTGDEKILVIKPQTFMNRSGEAVRKILDFYKVPIENICVLHDDLDIALGSVKVSTDSSAAGHNGVQSIINAIGSQQFKRIRIGIEGSEKKKERSIPGDVFVLKNFTLEEFSAITDSQFIATIAAKVGL